MRPKAGILFFLIAVLFTAQSCSNKWEHRLSEKEIETMLKELYIAQNLNSFRAPEDDNDTAALSLRSSLFLEHDISESDFDSVIAYYAHYKADRLSAMAKKASDQVAEELEQLRNSSMAHTDGDYTRFKGPESLDAVSLSSLIPKERYPATVLLSDCSDALFYTTRINDSIPKGSVIEAKITLYGIPLQIDQNDLPQMILSCSKGGKQPISAHTFIEYNGTSYLRLYFEKTLSEAQFSLFLTIKGKRRFMPLYVTELSLVPTIPEPSPEESDELPLED